MATRCRRGRSKAEGFTCTPWTLMIVATAVFKEAGTVGSSLPGPGDEPAGVRLAAPPVGLVRAGRGLARSGHDRAPQAGVRSGSTLQDEPPLRLADPGLEPLRFPGAGIVRVWRHPGLAAPRSLAVHARACARLALLTRHPGRLSADLHSGLVRRGAGGGGAARSAARARSPRFSGDSSWSVSRRSIAIVAILGASLWVGDRIKQLRESARPLPPPGSPNVLLIVMDTVAAGHLSLHGYDRATSTTLVELAERGIRFDSARAASSWTLPSHATMFTGRWLHELSVGWLTPLDRAHPTLAEFLGDRGYATAGFVANTRYCASDSGLGRGFTHYQDFIFPELTAFKTAVLVSRALDGFQVIVYFTEDWLESAGLLPVVQRLWRSLDTDRKGAAVVNRELLDWLSRRTQPERPFFAFLNYFDAHYPYQLPPGRLHRFGVEPTDNYQRILIQHWWDLDKTTLSPEDVAFAADAYDDCIADLDEQLGKLVDELDRRGILEQTWLIITSDHGESFGEHAGIFCHGTSLYETELHVPLLIIPPGGSATKQAVKETVSLRDLAATIVDVAGLEAGSPFPGDLAGTVLGAVRAGGTAPAPIRFIPRSPRWSRTTRSSAIPGAFPNNSLPWEPSRTETGRTSAERATSARSCSTCAKTRKSSATWPAIRPPGRCSTDASCAEPPHRRAALAPTFQSLMTA